MSSPFPGMNPYLERDAVWWDFSAGFLPLARELLRPQVPADSFVKIGERPRTMTGERQRYLEIRDRESRQLVTVLELFSPSNKYAGPDRDQYLAKRQELLINRVNLVEIDLLRGGHRLPLQNLTSADYYVFVSRPEEWPRVGVWPIPLRERLPRIPVPLRAPFPDAWLDLQDILHRIYDDAGYWHFIYEGQPEPALRPEDAAWARQFVPRAAPAPQPPTS